jgi:diaminopimelate decarboxylase
MNTNTPSFSPAGLVEESGELATLVSGLPGPTYIYDLAVLRDRVAELREAFSGFPSRLFFATMANDNPVILRQLSALGVGACVNSQLHLDLALEAKIPPTSIQFTATGLSRHVLEGIRDLNLTVNVDSLRQINIAAALGISRAGLRINASSLDPARPFDRMGTDISELGEALSHAAGCGVQIIGLHVYLGTNVGNPCELVPALQKLFCFALQVPDLEYLNIGGGIGVDYSHSGTAFDVFSYGEELRSLSFSLNSKVGREIEIVIEPGRGLAASCGRLVTHVTDRKALLGRNYLGVDASIAIFPRPFHHPETPHRIRSITKPEPQETTNFIVAGCTTFSRDILAIAELPASTEVGDLLVFDEAGAYSQSMISRFLGQPIPNSFYINKMSD